MKLILILILMIAGGTNAMSKNLQDFNYQNIENKEVSFSEYKDKVVLIANIATRCGYTKQLKGLESLYAKYKDKGLVVLGVPSNEFGQQTPEAEADVKKFCSLNYGVTFPLSMKYSVKGSDKVGFIAHILSELDNKEIGWNFEKFLVNKKGKTVKRFSSAVAPNSQELITLIEQELNK